MNLDTPPLSADEACVARLPFLKKRKAVSASSRRIVFSPLFLPRNSPLVVSIVRGNHTWEKTGVLCDNGVSRFAQVVSFLLPKACDHIPQKQIVQQRKEAGVRDKNYFFLAPVEAFSSFSPGGVVLRPLVK